MRSKIAGGILALIAALAVHGKTEMLASRAQSGSSQPGSVFVDDVGRTVRLPARVSRVLAAGFPSEVLIYTLVPDKLAARNRVPEGAAVEFFPPQYRTPRLIRQLPEVDDPAGDAELLAIKPDVFVDYGTIHPDYAAVLDAVQRRTGTPSILLDGRMARIPEVYRRLGVALGASARSEQLATAADQLLRKYRGMLSSSPPRVYLACSGDGVMPCLADDSASEQLAILGAVNVAGTRAASLQRPLTLDEIRALKPDVIIAAGGSGSAARIRGDAGWKSIEAVAAGRVYQPPALPFGWGARPPSVNRLPGLVWLAYVLRGQPFDAAFYEDVRMFFRDFYHLTPTDAQLRSLTEAG